MVDITTNEIITRGLVLVLALSYFVARCYFTRESIRSRRYAVEAAEPTPSTPVRGRRPVRSKSPPLRRRVTPDYDGGYDSDSE